jgi:hypothetical protein
MQRDMILGRMRFDRGKRYLGAALRAFVFDVEFHRGSWWQRRRVSLHSRVLIDDYQRRRDLPINIRDLILQKHNSVVSSLGDRLECFILYRVVSELRNECCLGCFYDSKPAP